MAAKKKAAPPTVPITQGVLEAGDAASGLADKKKGFCFDDEGDRLFALGWPHMVWLVPGEPTEKSLANDAAKFSSTYTASAGEVPIGVAPRLVRHLTYQGHDWSSKEWVDSVLDPSPITDKDAVERARLACRSQFGRVVVYLLEALRGTTWTFENVLGNLEALTQKEWTKGTVEWMSVGPILALHHMRLRLPTAASANAGKRLHALYDKVKGWNEHGSRAINRLETITVKADDLEDRDVWDHALLGPKHAKAIAKKFVPLLDTMKPADRVPCDARIVFLGGEPVMAAYARNAKNFYKDAKTDLVLELQRVNHPAVAEIMRTVGNGPAKKWLLAHA